VDDLLDSELTLSVIRRGTRNRVNRPPSSRAGLVPVRAVCGFLPQAGARGQASARYEGEDSVRGRARRTGLGQGERAVRNLRRFKSAAISRHGSPRGEKMPTTVAPGPAAAADLSMSVSTNVKLAIRPAQERAHRSDGRFSLFEWQV